MHWHCFAIAPETVESGAGDGAGDRAAGGQPRHVIALALTNEMHMYEPFHAEDTDFITRAAEILDAETERFATYQDWSGPTR